MVIDLFPLRRFRLSSFTEKNFSGTDYEYHETELLTLLEKFDSPPIFFVESVLLIILVLRSVVVFSGMAWGLVG